jgi:hypothetical protein
VIPALAQIGRHIPLDWVQVFPGNHCFYDHVLDGEDRLEQIVTTAGAGFAQCRGLTAGRVRLLPCTLWTDLVHPTIHPDIIAADLERGMNDYRYIRMECAGYRRTWPSDMRAVHQRHIAWLQEEMTRPHDGPTIVATHHAPLLEELGTTGTLGHAYGSDLTGFIEEIKPDAWLYGHTHRPHVVRVAGTEVRNVSLGYPSDLDDAEAR